MGQARLELGAAEPGAETSLLIASPWGEGAVVVEYGDLDRGGTSGWIVCQRRGPVGW